MRVYRYIHSWHNKTNNINIITIPMIHIASKQFYTEVSNIVNTCNLILEEGIPVSIDSEIGSYTRIAKKAGLVAQSNELKIEDDVKRIYIDIDKNEFEIGIKAISKNELRNVKIFKYILWSLTRKKILDMLYSVCAYPDSSRIPLINPDNHYSYKHNKSPLDLLVTNTRDDCISRNLQEIIDCNKTREYRYDISVLFGDEHMPIIYKTLQNNGFDWTLEKRIDLF